MRKITETTMRKSIVFLVGFLVAVFAPRLDARTFTSSSGKKLEAEIVSATESTVELKTDKGKTYKVPLTKLSKEDREFVADWRKEQMKSEALKGVTPAEVMEANGWASAEVLNQGGLLVIEVNIAGRATKVMIAMRPESLMLAPAAEEAGLSPTAPEGQQLPPGLKGLASPSVDIGGKQLKTPFKVLVIDNDKLPEKVRESAEAVMGLNYLEQSGAIIDWAAHKIWFPTKDASEDKEEDKEDE
jgi:hypothetical protein